MAGEEATFLNKIMAAHSGRLEEARARVSLSRVRQAAEARTERRDFANAISGGGLRLIAELKKASPTRGLLCPEYRPREIARAYEAAGASALSVLTEEHYFQGSLGDLEQARVAVRLPVLRKDFILDEYQVYESVAAGADALLLIVAALSDAVLRQLIELCPRLGITALVEVHSEEELDRAIVAGARIIGVNNRDLRTLKVDRGTSLRLRCRIPRRCIAVSESGIQEGKDLLALAEAGYNAALIGERLMASSDPGKALATLLRSSKIGSRDSNFAAPC